MSWVDVTTAVGTAGAAVIALGLGGRAEWRAMRAEQAQRDQSKRDQAGRVSGWPQGDREGKTLLALMNASVEPVYEVVVGMVLIQGGGARRLEEMNDLTEYRRVLSVLPPGAWHVKVSGGWGGMGKRPGIEIAFNDRSGRHWIRRSNGTLDEIDSTPIDYLQLGRPQSLELPIPGH